MHNMGGDATSVLSVTYRYCTQTGKLYFKLNIKNPETHNKVNKGVRMQAV